MNVLIELCVTMNLGNVFLQHVNFLFLSFTNFIFFVNLTLFPITRLQKLQNVEKKYSCN